VTEQLVGAALLAAILLDVFLTVLYARAGFGVFGRLAGRSAWHLFHLVAGWAGPYRGRVLSFGGPTLLVLLLAVWACGPALSCALIVHPLLGTAVVADTGATARDFVTALYVAGSSVATVGSTGYAPVTSGARMFFVLSSLAGMSVISMTLTYLLQVYSALHRRNTLALTLHAQSGETGNAAEVLAGLGPQGNFSGGYSSIATLASEVASSKEGHHFYPVLFYFRFTEPVYAISRFSLVALDLVALIKASLDDREYAWLKEGVAVEQLSRSSLLFVKTLSENFLREDVRPGEPDDRLRELWTRRYLAATRRLRQAGIHVRDDERMGIATYLRLRSQWDGYVSALAPALGYTLGEIDPATHDPEALDRQPPFEQRLRSIR
jgi:hypothetical protein